MGNYLIVFGG
jgi:hypothetical protein